MIRFTHPEWLILLPVLALAGWYWPRLGLLRPLRAVLLGLLLFVLVGPERRRQSGGLDVWALCDRSASCADLMEPRLGEMQTLLERSRGRNDRIFWLDYAEIVQPREGTTAGAFTGTRRQTRLGLAVQFALSRAEAGRATRLLALTDGYSTEPLGAAAERLADQQVALDYRLLAHPGAADVRAASLDLPLRVQRDEPFLAEAVLEGDADGPVPYVLLCDGKPLARGTATLRDGRAVVRYTDRLREAGARRYEIRLEPERDAFPGNNRADRWIEARGGPRILLVSAYPDDPLAAELRAAGFEVALRADPAALHPGELSGARVLILNNVPAFAVPRGFLDAVDFFVRRQGGGFLMVGGRNSFGAGGYFQSPVDPLLPVSMELKQEHRKLAVAMAFVLDRSGSMMAGVAGGRPGLTKMDLANEGAARSLELLGGMDEVTVIPVDSAAHVLLPMTRLDQGRPALLNAVRRIQSTGGGIFVYTGLDAAWKELKKSSLQQKHIILFADAADAEEPGEYKRLLAEITAAGGTVTVIGLGSEQDCDALFLQDVALRGKGRVIFNADALTLPAIFAQETVAVSRSAYLDEPTPPHAGAGWMEIAARPLAWPAAVDGYNLSYLREGATAAAVSGDEYEAPLVAFWQRGLGRAAAVSFPLAGVGAARARAWPGHADLTRTLARWLMGRDAPPGLALRLERQGTVLQVDLLHDARWEESFARRPPELVTAAGEGGEVRSHVWERIEPGRFRTAVRLEEEGWLRGVVQAGEDALPFGPVNAGGSAEWSFDRARLAELKQVAQRSGGQERVDLASVWKAPRPQAWVDVRPPALTLLLALFLVEALVTRIGGARVALAPLRTAARGARIPRLPLRRPPPSAPPPPSKPEPPPLPPPEGTPPPSSRRRAFDRAKRGL